MELHASQVTGLLALMAYIIAAALLLIAQRSEDVSSNPISFRVAAVPGAVLHAISIYLVVVSDAGLSIGFFSALSLTSLLTALLLLIVSIRQALEILGVVLFPLAGVFALVGGFAATETSVTRMELQWHILTSVMAYGMLTLAATQAIALALQTRHLRTLQPAGILAALPPINLMEKLLFQMIGIGFALLSLSLLTGVLFLEDIFAQHLVHKTTLSIVAWVVFGVLLAGRVLRGWRGRTALIYTISGFVLLIVGYFGSKLVLEFILAG